MKKLVSLSLALAMSLSLMACGGESSNTPAPAQSTTPAPVESTGPVEPAGLPEGYPSKNIEIIVPAAAGAALDLYTRAMNEVLDLGATLQITNMAGGSQTIGMMELANRAADGYSMGIVAFAGGIIQPQLTSVTYGVDSFRPVAITSGPNSYSVCVRCGGAVTDWDSFLELISSGETVHWTAPNAGSPAHLAGLYFLKELGIENCEFVSYNGAAEALTAMLSGDVAFYITDDSVVRTREEEKQVTGIITLSDVRSAVLPDVICAKEKGIDGMGVFDAFSWVVLPKDTPDAVYDYIKEKIDAAVTSDQYQQFLRDNNFVEMQVYTEEELNEKIHSAYDAVSEVIGMLG